MSQTETITRFPLSRFDEIAPVLMECFPDFWNARFARNERSFAYTLKLFAMKCKQRIIGTVGIHDYQFLLSDVENQYQVYPACGLCDLGVIPEMRGRGYAGMMQEFVKSYVSQHNLADVIPLYTDKPDVYTRRGWFLYEPDRTQEIRTADFPLKHPVRIDARKLRCDFIRFKVKTPVNAEEELFQTIHRIYNAGKTFPGKVMRSSKTWLELFSAPEYEWQLDGETYFLYANKRLIEACSADAEHPVNGYTPVNGNYEHNCIMLNLQNGASLPETLRSSIQNRTLQFPAADIF